MNPDLPKHKDVLQEVISLARNPGSQGYHLNLEGQQVWVLGAGKASVQMAHSLVEQEKVHVRDGIIISNTKEKASKKVQVFKGNHPYPDKSSVSASYELLNLARSIPTGATVLFLLSGGASSLLCIPPHGIEIEELAKTYKLLLESGAPIHEMNVVRKHLCMLKGGQLAQALHHANLITLAISDVPGNDLESIGSAPTVCDSSTFKDAFQILKKFGLWNEVPHAIRIHIAKGMSGDIPDTPKPGINEHPSHTIKIISDAASLAGRVADYLQKEGFHSWVAPSAYNDEVKKVAKQICSAAISVLSKNDPVPKPAALVFFGESTVEVKGKGKGGRNMELALASAISIEGQHPVSMLSIGTDGIDGPTDAAGAIIDSETTLQARKKKLDPEKFLQENDSYHFHEAMETLIKTGPTGNNLMDLQVVIIG